MWGEILPPQDKKYGVFELKRPKNKSRKEIKMNDIKMSDLCKVCGHGALCHFQLRELDEADEILEGTQCSIDGCECKEFKK